jgi:hypothetical protein
MKHLNEKKNTKINQWSDFNYRSFYLLYRNTKSCVITIIVIIMIIIQFISHRKSKSEVYIYMTIQKNEELCMCVEAQQYWMKT